MKALTTSEDREALADLINDWKRLGEHTLLRLSLNQPWNMPLYFAISAAVLNRREIMEFRKSQKSQREEATASCSKFNLKI
jgi:hypothetical protein